MSCGKEIGGYFELECGHNAPYHRDALKFNSARSALRYLIRQLAVKKIHVPYYTCPVVWQAIACENCAVVPYEIDDNFAPMQDFPKSDFILYNNYFGVCGKNVTEMSVQYPNLIVDNAQAFYAAPQGRASFYSPRKFFGLPDGGLLIAEGIAAPHYEQSTSFDKCLHLLKRHDLGAAGGYDDFRQNDASLDNAQVSAMSKLTEALCGNIDYQTAKKIRLQNFAFLHRNLQHINKVTISPDENDVPMVYPLEVDDLSLRQKLIENKVYVARYWPKEENCDCMSGDKAQKAAETILPLPVDQRYDISDMNRILEIINV